MSELYTGPTFWRVLTSTFILCSACSSALGIASQPVQAPEGSLQVTVSVGAVSSSGIRDLGAECFLRAADQALYRAKSSGRNRVEIVSPEALREQIHAPQPATPQVREGEPLPASQG